MYHRMRNIIVDYVIEIYMSHHINKEYNYLREKRNANIHF